MYNLQSFLLFCRKRRYPRNRQQFSAGEDETKPGLWDNLNKILKILLILC